jgi:hypothetical protein
MAEPLENSIRLAIVRQEDTVSEGQHLDRTGCRVSSPPAESTKSVRIGHPFGHQAAQPIAAFGVVAPEGVEQRREQKPRSGGNTPLGEIPPVETALNIEEVNTVPGCGPDRISSGNHAHVVAHTPAEPGGLLDLQLITAKSAPGRTSPHQPNGHRSASPQRAATPTPNADNGP